MKQCSKCKEYKNLEVFTLNKECRDGRTGICKPCKNRSIKIWKQKNSLKLSEKRRQDYKTRYSAIARENERKRATNKPYQVRAALMRQGMRTRSKFHNIPFDDKNLTVAYLKNWLKAKPNCECCGVLFDIGFKFNGANNRSPSIDRIVPLNGYVLNNVALLCWRCNNLKRDATASELRKIADWMDSNGPLRYRL